jgi:hypothetical protein
MCALCGCSSQDFMGVAMPNQNVYDVGATGLVSVPSMFRSESEESLAHENSESKGSNGEDID